MRGYVTLKAAFEQQRNKGFKKKRKAVWPCAVSEFAGIQYICGGLTVVPSEQVTDGLAPTGETV
jgi:hypothetical protein